MRIGVGGLSCECCTFSPATTGEDDFVVLRGDAIREGYPFLADHPGVEFIPLIRARALPGGSIQRSFYDRMKRDLLSGIAKHAPWDGLLLFMHGAAHVSGLDDTEGDLLHAIREAAGPRCMIAASYDLHGNVSPRVIRNLNILTAYRTAPHRDVYETARRACALLVQSLRAKAAPARAFVPVPILLPGEQTSTEWEPGAGLYRAIPDVIERYGILDASILIGYLWADEPRSSASVVVHGMDADRANEAAKDLARRLWNARTAFRFGTETGSVDECITKAVRSGMRPVVISDSGDNPTAGGAGDVPYVLERLLALDAREALFASIADPAAVTECVRVGAGAEIEVSLGGKLDPVHGRPLAVRARVVSVHATTLAIGVGAAVPNTIAVLEVGGVRVIATERRTPFHRRRDFEQLGLDPGAYHVLVVKIGYLEPELKELAAMSLLALSPGAVNQDLHQLPFRRVRRPMYPLDPDMNWEPPARNLV